MARIPGDDLGFLWMEGASIIDGPPLRPDEPDELVEFVRDEILSVEYQRALLAGEPYGAAPVNAEAVADILKSERPEWLMKCISYAASTVEEATMIFNTPTTFNSNIRVRRMPSNATAWEKCWADIRRDLCTRH